MDKNDEIFFINDPDLGFWKNRESSLGIEKKRSGRNLRHGFPGWDSSKRYEGDRPKNKNESQFSHF